MQAYAAPVATLDAVKAELKKRNEILLQESWFIRTQELEDFDDKKARRWLSDYIKDLKKEDNLFRLGEKYLITQKRLDEYKHWNVPALILLPWAAPVILTVA